MEDKKILIGRRIKQRREELGLTQEDLGNKLFLNKSTIQRYESGKVEKIKIPVLHAMAKALDVNPEWLALKTDVQGHFSENYNFAKEEDVNDDIEDENIIILNRNARKMSPEKRKQLAEFSRIMLNGDADE